MVAKGEQDNEAGLRASWFAVLETYRSARSTAPHHIKLHYRDRVHVHSRRGLPGAHVIIF